MSEQTATYRLRGLCYADAMTIEECIGAYFSGRKRNG